MSYKAFNIDTILGIFLPNKIGSTKSKISQNPGKTGVNPLSMLEITYLTNIWSKIQARAMLGI